jgi:hypothetical protein
MNNRYNYDRRRNYGSRNNNTGSNAAGFIVFLISLSIILGIWVINLKSDIRSLSDDKQMVLDKSYSDIKTYKQKNDSLILVIDWYRKQEEERKKVKPKIFRRPNNKENTTVVETKMTDTTKIIN